MGTIELTRREFLRASAAVAFAPAPVRPARVLRFGLIADLHHGLQPDAERRLAAFLEAGGDLDLDFIVQMGDFCHPTPEGRALMRLWEQYPGTKRHVLGNHDMDLGTKREIMDVWGMREAHYAFDAGAFRFVVLDCNFILKDGKHVDYANSNYYIDSTLRDRVSPEQIEWLDEELGRSDKPVVVLSHQAFDEVWTGSTVPNRLDVRRVIDAANTRSQGRVLACLCGHHHLDEASVLQGVHYVHVNSASYHWIGDGFRGGPRAVYRDPLFAFAALDPAGVLKITGRTSAFESPTPGDVGVPNAERLHARISNRTLAIHPVAGVPGGGGW